MKRVPVADRRGRAAGGQPPKEARASSKDLDYQLHFEATLWAIPAAAVCRFRGRALDAIWGGLEFPSSNGTARRSLVRRQISAASARLVECVPPGRVWIPWRVYRVSGQDSGMLHACTARQRSSRHMWGRSRPLARISNCVARRLAGHRRDSERCSSSTQTGTRAAISTPR